jgi:hypothetical protein
MRQLQSGDISAKLKHSNMNLFEFDSSIKLEPDPLEVQRDSSKAALRIV